MQKASFSSIFVEEPKSQGIGVAYHYMEVDYSFPWKGLSQGMG